jgi:hypothetical protein
MINQDVLEAGVARGVLTPDQVQQLRALAGELTKPPIPEPQDDEKLRFITGFNDIFVTIGIGLFIGAIGYFLNDYAGTGGAAIVIAVSSWLLADFFTRKRRMAFPSIVLLCIFAWAVFWAAAAIVASLFVLLSSAESESATTAFNDLNRFRLDDSTPSGIIFGASVVTVLLTALHYWRFRVPITIAVGVAALIGVMLAVVEMVSPGFVSAHINALLAVGGLCTFALAMRYDLSDPLRVTRRTDIAFWLHMLAAPLIVHPIVSQLIDGVDEAQTGNAVLVLAIFLLLGIIAVVIDRRAMLVSGLSYAGYAFVWLFSKSGLSDHAFPATLLALGAFVLLLSAGWRPVRRFFLGLLPDRFARNLPHPLSSA